MSRSLPLTLCKMVSLIFLSFTLLSMADNGVKSFNGHPSCSDTIIAKDSIKYIDDGGYATTYLALGDSYTIGQSVPQKERYPFQTVDLLQKAGYKMRSADIIATTGWTTADLMQGIKEKSINETYDLVSLLIGVNDQYRRRSLAEYRNHFTILLKKSIKLAGDRPSRVFVLSIPDYSVTPFANNSDRKKISQEIDMFNRENKKIAGMYKVNYLNITPESRKAAINKSLIAYDDLHFSGKEYGIWASMLVPMITKVLK